MHFPEELVKPNSLKIPAEANVKAKESRMATELINRMSERWQPDKYTDDYRHSLEQLIEKKIKLGGKSLPGGPARSRRQPTKVIDLVSVLKQSLERTGKQNSTRDKRKMVHKRAA